MNQWSYVGSVPLSKSMLNRAILMQSYFPNLQLSGDSLADDVVLMKKGIGALGSGTPIDCGHAGTVLRFLALRAARIPGRHELVGSLRLFSRPHDDLLKALMQLGCQVELENQRLLIRSWGWKLSGDALHVGGETSSQFLSSLVLNAWDLPFPLYISVGGPLVSEGYFTMTLKMVERLGMRVESRLSETHIPAGQKCIGDRIEVEPDMSCAFALAAAAVVSGHAVITPFPQLSIQPDGVFVGILQNMGAAVSLGGDGKSLKVDYSPQIKPIELDLRSSPDLFPVLAAVCAQFEGRSVLSGADHLAHKESHRIEKTAELLRLCGRNVVVRPDGLEVKGCRGPLVKEKRFFDPDHDHRMAMAAAVLMKGGEDLEILHPEVVNKSYPNFWESIHLPFVLK